jgi:hypothetical protein
LTRSCVQRRVAVVVLPAEDAPEVARGAEGALPEDGSVVRVYLEDAFWGIMQRNGDMLAWKCQIAPEERGEPTACGGYGAGKNKGFRG